MSLDDLDWDYPDPHIIEHTASGDEADGYGHINNSVYLKWLDQCVWDHCNAVDMTPEFCRELNRGFAAVRHEIDYIASAYPGDRVAIANWVTVNDRRLRAERRFQIIRLDDERTLLRARSFYVCTDLTTGRPTRMPEAFKTGFEVLPGVALALGHPPAHHDREVFQ
jgi:acyl-CoA thioester hydrolase